MFASPKIEKESSAPDFSKRIDYSPYSAYQSTMTGTPSVKTITPTRSHRRTASDI